MRHRREQAWWLAACAAGIGLAWLTGGFIGPIIAVFVLVFLAGAALIEFDASRPIEPFEESTDAVAPSGQELPPLPDEHRLIVVDTTDSHPVVVYADADDRDGLSDADADGADETAGVERRPEDAEAVPSG